VKHCPSEELVFMLAAGELAAEEAARLEAHVRGCDRCAKLLTGYQETLTALSAEETRPEEIGTPSEAEWSRLMAGVRQRVRPGSSAPRLEPARPGVSVRQHAPARPRVLSWPVWAKGAAGGGVVAVAAAVVVIVLWQAGLFTGPRPDVAPGLAARGQTDRSAPEMRELPGVSEPSGQEADEQDLLAGELLAGDLPAEDGSTVNLASLDTELPELDDLVSGVGGTQDSDFMLLYLTEEEQTRLIEELEASTNTLEFD
jgi:hypothetical protein